MSAASKHSTTRNRLARYPHSERRGLMSWEVTDAGRAIRQLIGRERQRFSKL